MEQAPHMDSALEAIFFDSDIENGQHPELFRGIFVSGDLETAFGMAETQLGIDLDHSLDRQVNNLAR